LRLTPARSKSASQLKAAASKRSLKNRRFDQSG
jgi:hypothetical protein